MKRLISVFMAALLIALTFGSVPVAAAPASSMAFTDADLEADENRFTQVTQLTIGRGEVGVNAYAAQAFVPTVDYVTGCRLHFRLGDNATMTIQVRTALEGGNETILYSGNYPLVSNPHNITDWWDFEFTRPVKLNKGQTYYLVFWCDIYHSQCIASSTQYVVSGLTNPGYRKMENSNEWTEFNQRCFGYEMLSDPNAKMVGFPYEADENALMLHHAEEYYCFAKGGEKTALTMTDKTCSQGYFSMQAVGNGPQADGSLLSATVSFDTPTDFSDYNYFYTDLFLAQDAEDDLGFTYTLQDQTGNNGLTGRVSLQGYTKGWHRIILQREDMVLTGSDVKQPASVVLRLMGKAADTPLTVCFDNLRAAKKPIPLVSDTYYTDEELANIPIQDGEYIGKPSEPVTLFYGDVNEDNIIGAPDALAVLQYVVGKNKLSGKQYKSGDVTADNNLNANDALQILRYTVSKVKTFAAESVVDESVPEVDFHLSADGLSKDTIYSITTTAIAKTDSFMPHDAARLATSLQGLLNREIETNRVALVLTDKHADTWVSYIKENDDLLQGMTNTVAIADMKEFLKVFESQLKECGMILWDPNVPSTSNVAATICGLNGYLPVKYDVTEGSLYQTLTEMGVPVRMSLVDKFDGKGLIPDTLLFSTGSKKCDPYLWALEQVSARCSDYYTVYLPDGASATVGNTVYENDVHSKSLDQNKLFNHDYGIYRKAFFFDLTPIDVEAPCDDPTQKLGTDRQTLIQILTNRYYRAGGAFGEVVGFPPWALKYATHNGWGSVEATVLEGTFTELITMYNCYLDADGSLPNCSLYTQFALQDSYESIANQKPVTEQFDENTMYLYMYTGDYDSSPWAVEHMIRCYNDPARGSIPITWSFTPGLANRIPMVVDYLYRYQTENDYFSASDSGVGYVRPQGLFQSESGRVLPDGDQAFVKLNKEHFERFDLDSVGFLIGKLSPKVCHTYNQFAPVGSNSNDSSWTPAVYNGAPYIRIKNGIGDPATTDEAMETTVSGMFDYAQSMRQYNVAGFRTIKFTAGDLKRTQEAFLEYAKEKDPDTTYKFVDYKTYFAMMKQSGAGRYTLN